MSSALRLVEDLPFNPILEQVDASEEQTIVDGQKYIIGDCLTSSIENAQNWLGKTVMVFALNPAGGPLHDNYQDAEDNRKRWNLMEPGLVLNEISRKRDMGHALHQNNVAIGQLILASKNLFHVSIPEQKDLFTGFFRNDARTPTHSILPIIGKG